MHHTIIRFAGAGALALLFAGCNGSATSVAPFGGGGGGLATPQPTNPAAPTASYVQIELLSRPAVKEALENFNDHKTTNKVEPYAGSPADPLQAEIKSTEDTLRPPAMTPSGAADYGAALQSILYPNELAVNLAATGNASYLGVETGGATGGTFGGRDINDDVIGISLGALFGNTLSALHVQPDDGEENNCLSKQNVTQNPSQAKTASFPYFAAPH